MKSGTWNWNSNEHLEVTGSSSIINTPTQYKNDHNDESETVPLMNYINGYTALKISNSNVAVSRKKNDL